MYGSLGETELERQTRERESVQTDSILAQLFPKAQPLSELTTTVKGGWLFPLLAGALAVWFLGGKSQHRSLWLVLLCLLTGTLQAQQEHYGIPAGPTDTPKEYWCDGRTTGTYITVPPDYVLGRLQRAKECQYRIFVVFPRSRQKSSDGKYSVSANKQLIADYAKKLPSDTIKKYADNFSGFIIADDMACAACWGKSVVTQAQVAEVAKEVRQKIPLALVGIRGIPQWIETYSGWNGSVDFGWAQYHTHKGNVKTFYDEAVKSAARQKIAVALGINLSDCHGPGSGPCTATELQTFGRIALGYATNCAFEGWTWDQSWFISKAIRLVWTDLLARAKVHSFRTCRKG